MEPERKPIPIPVTHLIVCLPEVVTKISFRFLIGVIPEYLSEFLKISFKFSSDNNLISKYLIKEK